MDRADTSAPVTPATNKKSEARHESERLRLRQHKQVAAERAKEIKELRLQVAAANAGELEHLQQQVVWREGQDTPPREGSPTRDSREKAKVIQRVKAALLRQQDETRASSMPLTPEALTSVRMLDEMSNQSKRSLDKQEEIKALAYGRIQDEQTQKAAAKQEEIEELKRKVASQQRSEQSPRNLRPSGRDKERALHSSGDKERALRAQREAEKVEQQKSEEIALLRNELAAAKKAEHVAKVHNSLMFPALSTRPAPTKRLPGEAAGKIEKSTRQAILTGEDDDRDDSRELPPVSESDNFTKQLIFDSVGMSVLFQGFDDQQKTMVTSVMSQQLVKKGEMIIREGDDGDKFYVVEDGVVDVWKIFDGEHKRVSIKRRGDCFGDLALLYESPRNATCLAATDCKLRVLERRVLNRIARTMGQQRLETYTQWLKKVCRSTQSIVPTTMTNEACAF